MKAIIVSLSLFIALASQGGEVRVHKKLDWQGNQKVEIGYQKLREAIVLGGGFNLPDNDYLPVMVELIPMGSDGTVDISIENARYEVMTALPAEFVGTKITSAIQFKYKVGYLQGKPQAKITYTPLRKNATGQIEKLVEFDMVANITAVAARRAGQRATATTSVLSTGTWYKISIPQDGMFKMDYAFLKDLGLNVDNIDPRNIRVYGNGGGMLPESNAVSRHDDLTENPIVVAGESDGKFNTNDFVLFYGKGPTTWGPPDVSGHFSHNTNIYSNAAYYFVTVGGTGKRISSIGQASNATVNVNSFDDHQLYEQELINLLHSGRTFYGDFFNFSVPTKTVTFDFPNLTSDPIFIRTNNAARYIGSGSSIFTYTVNGTARITSACSGVDGNFENNYASQNTGTASFATSNPINVGITFSPPSSSAEGWLDYVEINARRNLTNTGNQFSFRDTRSVGASNVTRFTMQNANENLRVLDVTDPTNAQQVSGDLNSGQFAFTLATPALREFFVYQDGGAFPTPTKVGQVANQNLHATGQVKMIIATNPALKDAANRLADFHRNRDGMRVAVVDIQQIYNEFSSGAQDLVGIRDFVRMLYDRAAGDTANMPKFLALMGRASYDYKDITANNTNLLPVYEAPESLNPVGSYCTDDFFGFLDANEGADDNNGDLIDINIGRLIAATPEAANILVDKTIHYTTTASLGNWRNNITLIADDIDNGTHLSQAETLANNYIESQFPVYNVDKIYLDAYKRITTPAGDRYPDVNDAINKKMFTGTLVMNYTGHGGVNGLSHTRCLNFDDIRSWTNYDKLSLFITATCEFTRFDNPDFISAGEEVLLNAKGGAVASVSTVRLSLSFQNAASNQLLTNALFKPVPGSGGRMPTLGEAVKISKNLAASSNTRVYDLFGDPALTLAYPTYNVVTTNIDAHPISIVTDTLKALQKVTIKGEVRDLAGNRMTSFNGTVYPTIFDKQMTVKTLGNCSDCTPTPFKLLKNIIFKGKASVVAGEFSYTFVVPKDIAYNYGFGKISYYADNNSIDAHGYTNIMVGGNVQGAAADANGPELKLFMNNDKFVFGGLTDPSPILLVHLQDLSGINTAGNGVGHDINGVLDENTKNTLALNDFYEAEKDDYQKGTVRYPLSKLENGRHSMKVKAWDVYNNSAEGYTEFIVASSADLALSHVLNYPNPFTTSTNFQFEHNKPGQMLFVQVKIYTVTGKLVKTIQDNILTEGYRVDNIHWDGLDDYGDKIGKGVYVYKLAVSSAESGVAHQFEKLVILR